MPYRQGTFLSGIFACSMYFVPQAPIGFKLLFPAWGLWTTIEVIMHDDSGRDHRDDCVSWASAFQSSPTWQLVFVQTASRAKPQTRRTICMGTSNPVPPQLLGAGSTIITLWHRTRPCPSSACPSLRATARTIIPTRRPEPSASDKATVTQHPLQTARLSSRRSSPWHPRLHARRSTRLSLLACSG